MKKVILITLFFVSFVAIKAQESIETTKLSETERVIDKYLDKTGDVIESLAEKLKVPAGHVYEILVRQQIVKGLTLIVAVVILAVLTLLSFLLLKSRHNFKREWYLQNTEGYWFLFILLAIALLIFLVLFMTTGIPSLINPEYGAIKEILSIL